MRKQLFYCLLIIVMAGCRNNNKQADNGKETGYMETNPRPAVINYSVVNVYPHNTRSFTEGLLIHEGVLYESTGSPDSPENNGSWLGVVDMATGKIDKKVELDKMYFGEGITILNGRIYQLTYQHHKGFVYDAVTYKKLQEFSYTGEGWSLTNDGTHLIMSDGTSKLRYLDPVSLKLVKILGVEDNNGPVPNINELEYIDGYLYANQWLTNYILKIDLSSGKVVGKIDFSRLAGQVKAKYPGASEMNGIAYDKDSGKIYITGKCWPDLYEVQFK